MARDAAQLLEMGQRIAELRAASGLNQQTIADYCGVKLRAYQFWQQGKHPPTGDALIKLAELFDVTPRYILRGGERTPDLFSGEGPSQLDQIEAQLRELNQRIGELQKLIDTDAITVAIQRAFDDYAARLGEQIGKRPPRSRRTADRRPAEPEAAA